MAHQVCPRCQRTNPEEAVFCYFDGVVLRQLPGGQGNQLPHEFVFPSGRRCRTFDELVQGCQYEWEDARGMLGKGVFGSFLASIGRMDLARAAQENQSQTDPDIALHNFLNTLPASQIQGPRLDLTPRRLLLGTLRAGDTRLVRLTVTNLGQGLLQGKLTVAEGSEWLHVDGASGPGNNGQCPLKTAREQQVILRIDTKGLPAPQTYSARLQVITNGGIVEVPVRLDLVSVPFPRPPYQGVTTPRELAERMRAQPKPAVSLLESGDVERWFNSNGWAYPVQGPTAKGVAAVQQFFEGMGLSKPPPLQLSQNEFQITCNHPEVVKSQVTLRTSSKKWVYAQISSDAPWLRVTTPTISGPQQATISFEIDTNHMAGGRTQQATLQIAGNAGQRMSVRVHVDVHRPQESIARKIFGSLQDVGQQASSRAVEAVQTAAVAESARAAHVSREMAAAPAAPLTSSWTRPILVMTLLAFFYRGFLCWPADLFARVLMAPSGSEPRAGSFGYWLMLPAVDSGFIKHFVFATFWLGGIFGLALLAKRGSRATDAFSGLIAGAVAGVMGAATFACLMPILDVLAWGIWHFLFQLGIARSSVAASPWLWTPLWMLTAVMCWTILGPLLGLLLRLAGQRGVQVIAWLGWPVSAFFQLLGLRGAAAFFALQQ